MILWDLPAWYMWGMLFILGAVIGSFLNVCVYRLPLHENVFAAWKGVTSPPSSCPFCRRRILSRDNVPIFGWLWLRGRCRFCRHRIPFRYPLIEFVNGALFVLLYVSIVPAGYSTSFADSQLYSDVSPLRLISRHDVQTLWLHLQFLYYLVLVEALLVASLIDFDLQIIPDSVTLPAMAVGVLGSLTGVFYLVPVWSQNPSLVWVLWSVWNPPDAAGTVVQPPWWTQVTVPAWCLQWPMLHGLAVSLAGLIIGGGVIWFIRIAGAWVFRREAMGFGDVILMAMIGSFLGWQPTLIVFFVAPLCALVSIACTMMVSRPREIPFGPYLSLAALLVIVAWKPLYLATERFFSLGPFVPLLAIVMAVTLVAVLWLVQGIKHLLGIPLYEEEPVGEWTSADQLAFYASKDATAGTRAMIRPEWTGASAGQGRLQQQRWLGR